MKAICQNILKTRLGRSLLVLLFLSLFVPLAQSELQAQAPQDYSTLFTEEVLVVNRERDGLLPGTLRTVLIQASGIRSQNSFTLVKIVFDPKVRRVQITKGPLPEIDGSLTTLDCSHPQGKVILEYVPREDDAGFEPDAEENVLTVTSNSNTVKFCHITGAPGVGLSIQGNRNLIEHNTIGYHSEVNESVVPASALFGPPNTNKKSGLYLGRGANENTIQHNDIVGNTYHGVLIGQGAGTANRILYNYFARNSGQAIKAQPGTRTTVTPSIQKISQEGESFLIQGTASPGANVQIYMVGKGKGEIEMLVAQEGRHPKNNSSKFQIETKSKGFILGETKLVALAQGINQNTSEFSTPILVGKTKESSASTPVINGDNNLEAEENEEENTEFDDEEEEVEAEEGNKSAPAQAGTVELHPEDRPDHPGKTNSSTTRNTGSQTGSNLGNAEPETVINLNGQGDGGGTPDSGSQKQNEVSSLGI